VKEIIIPRQSNNLLFVIGPCITLIFALLGWSIIPFGEGLTIFDYELGVFFALAVSSIGSYGILISGWAANSKYAFMGAIRSTAQLLSYELVFSSIILILILFSGSFSLTYIVECQQAVWNIFPLLPIALMFFIAILAETNRPPFDLPEARFGQLKNKYLFLFFNLKFIKCWKPFYIIYYVYYIILNKVISKILYWQFLYFLLYAWIMMKLLINDLQRFNMNIII
jgi:NADH:ubiquinone oxidoreductase subunit H